MEHESGTGPASGRRGHRLRDLEPTRRRLFVLAMVVVALPFALAAVAAHADGWIPVGDNARIAVAADQVLTAHPPLVGQVTSSEIYGVVSHHPGPLLFQLDAPFVALLGPAAGLLVAAALLQGGSLALSGYVALRVAGPGRAYGLWAVALAAAVSLDGVAYLYDPYHTVVVVLPLLLTVVACWAVLAGHRRFLPLAVGAGSLVAQAAAQYLPVVAVLGLVTVAGALLGARRSLPALQPVRGPRSRRPSPALAQTALATALLVLLAVRPDPVGVLVVGAAGLGLGLALLVVLGRRIAPRLRPLGRSLGLEDPSRLRWALLTLLVGGACWVAPLGEALANGGGNVEALREAAAAASAETYGLAQALGWGGLAVVFAPATLSADQPGALATLLAVGVVGALVSLSFVRWRVLDRVDRALVTVTGVFVAATVGSAARYDAAQPFEVFRLLALSVAAVLVWFTIGSLVVPLVRARRVTAGPRWAEALGPAAVGMLAVVLAVPLPVDEGREYAPWTFAAVDDLAPEVAAETDTSGMWLGLPAGPRSLNLISDGLQGALEHEGIPTGIVRPPGLGWDTLRDRPPLAGWFIVAPATSPRPDGWEVVGEHVPEGWDEVAAAAVADEAVAHAERTGATLTALGQAGIGLLTCPPLAADLACDQSGPSLGPAVADLPPWAVALAYVESPSPVVAGPPPPPELVDRLREEWSAMPVVVLLRRVDDAA